MREITEEMIEDRKKIDSSKKVCDRCGRPYRKIDQILTIFGKEIDKSYWIPTCTCRQIEKERQARKIAGQRIAAKIRRLKDCGINARFKNKTFSNFVRERDPNAYSVCRKYARSFGKNKKEGMLLTGLAGNGKTHLSVAIADNVARLKHRMVDKIVFTTVPDMVKRMRADMLNNRHKFKEDLFSCNLLILDDLGAEAKTDWTKDICHELIDYRYRESLPTVITTNLGIYRIKDIYGERIFSRIYEMCNGVELSGKDYRVGD